MGEQFGPCETCAPASIFRRLFLPLPQPWPRFETSTGCAPIHRWWTCRQAVDIPYLLDATIMRHKE